MGMYLYEHPETGEVKEIFQYMKDKHEFFDEKGLKWTRVFTVPQASIDAKIDPYNKRDFVEKTKNKRGTLGDLFDQSRELSDKRAYSEGKDVVKDNWEKNWSKRRGGKKFVPQTNINNLASMISSKL